MSASKGKGRATLPRELFDPVQLDIEEWMERGRRAQLAVDEVLVAHSLVDVPKKSRRSSTSTKKGKGGA